MRNYKISRRAFNKRQCAKGSFRIIKRGRARLLICCPKGKGHWNTKTHRCRVGTRAYEVLEVKQKRR